MMNYETALPKRLPQAQREEKSEEEGVAFYLYTSTCLLVRASQNGS
jgi:hypothetical protein